VYKGFALTQFTNAMKAESRDNKLSEKGISTLCADLATKIQVILIMHICYNINYYFIALCSVWRPILSAMQIYS
jgi:hypothetical protein